MWLMEYVGYKFAVLDVPVYIRLSPCRFESIDAVVLAASSEVLIRIVSPLFYVLFPHTGSLPTFVL
jgi:hypothetical protein